MSGLHLRPVTRDEARKFVGVHHRHNLPPKMVLLTVGIEDDDGLLRGVAIVERPKARALDDGWTAEVSRLATDGVANGCSMLYGACVRACKAIGYRRIYTYTLQRESGSSLKASGWTLDADLDARGGWDCPSRPRVNVDLFGNERTPTEAKYRWVQILVPVEVVA